MNTGQAQETVGSAGVEWTCWVPLPLNVLKANFHVTVFEDGFSTVACVVRDNARALLLVAGFQCDGDFGC